jgi:soluble lytic murein transglycosylase-like protein
MDWYGLEMQTRFFIPVIALGALTATAWADELVTLRNGFEMRCDHHAETQGRVRLYLSAGEDNYIELMPKEIAGVLRVADPPPTAIAQQPAAGQATASPVLVPEQTKDAKLSAADLREMLAKAGSEHNLDVDLLASLVKAESAGNAHAVSHTGARGLMQLMPGTAAELGVGDSFKPEQNVRGGSTYLDELLTYYHNNLALALAAYNAGPAVVDKYRAIPPYRETQAYVARVIHEFNRRVLAREAQARQAVARASNSPENSAR